MSHRIRTIFLVSLTFLVTIHTQAQEIVLDKESAFQAALEKTSVFYYLKTSWRLQKTMLVC